MYDFKTMVKREGSGSIKWSHRRFKRFPLSTADTDFKTAPEITEGLVTYLNEFNLGYTQPTDSYYASIIDWFERKHHFKLEKEWLFDSAGVLDAIEKLIISMTQKGDGIVILEPVYYPFRSIIEKHERQVLTSHLRHDEGVYTIDFDDLEEQLKQASMLLFCSPHNPVGRVCSDAELITISNLCTKYNVRIVSDEIHSDIVLSGHYHHVFSKIHEGAIVLHSASKTFNLAGLQTAVIIMPSLNDRSIYNEYLEYLGLHTLNALGPVASELAFTKGEAWLKEFLEVVESNHHLLKRRFEEGMEDVLISPLEGTYLQWIDFSKMFSKTEDFNEYLHDYVGIDFDEGSKFSEEYAFCLRINIACSKDVLIESLDWMIEAYDLWSQGEIV